MNTKRNPERSLTLLTIFAVAMIAFAAVMVIWATHVNAEPAGVADVDQAKRKMVVQQCPKTKMTESCFACHVAPSFRLKEDDPEGGSLCPRNAHVEAGVIGHYYLVDIDDQAFAEAIRYFRRHDIRHLVVDIHSPGGSLFRAQRIIGMIAEWQAQGGTVATRVYGFAASAGFIVFVAGDQGQRFVAPQAQLMWHELMSFKLFDIATPADKEDEARVLRHLQDNINHWMAGRSKLSKTEIDEKIRKREFWMSGKDAVAAGFADGFVTEKR